MVTIHFLLATVAGMSGGPIVHGYNTCVVNTPSLFIRDFYTKAFATRAGLYPCHWADAGNYSESGNSSKANASSSDFDEKKCLSQLESQMKVDLLWNITVAIFYIGGILAALASGKMADRLGRKNTLLVGQAMSLLSALSSGLAIPVQSPELIVLGRFLVGLAAGLGISVAPLYLGELATTTLRGPATAACQLAVNIGMLMAQLFGLSEILGNAAFWPYLFVFNALPSCVAFLLLPFCPESPRHIMNTRVNGFDEARRAYVWLYGESQGEAETLAFARELRFRSPVKIGDCSISKIQTNSLLGPCNQDADAKQETSFHENHHARNEDGSTQEKKSPGMVTLLQFFSSKEFRLPIFIAVWLHVAQQWSGVISMSSYSSVVFRLVLPANLVQYAVLLTGAAALLGTSIILPLLARLNRRPLILLSCLTMAICHVVLTLCGTFASSIPVLNYGSGACLILYYLCYAGCGCAPATIVSEMFLQNARAIGMSLAVATRWGTSLLLLFVFPYMWAAMGIYTFLVFGMICLLCFVVFFFWLHETRGRSASRVHEALEHGFVRYRKSDSQ